MFPLLPSCPAGKAALHESPKSIEIWPNALVIPPKFMSTLHVCSGSARVNNKKTEKQRRIHVQKIRRWMVKFERIRSLHLTCFDLHAASGAALKAKRPRIDR
ncbi:unnamed protein product [Mesocestoides corti]|uniref:Uncharacterized protein n=1 Tax=Mesocestoides corti TaxID=53468 RepID=A0A0R3UPI1_MESCO|nr:unnamed protein product [Mesocestoides corti]